MCEGRTSTRRRHDDPVRYLPLGQAIPATMAITTTTVGVKTHQLTSDQFVTSRTNSTSHMVTAASRIHAGTRARHPRVRRKSTRLSVTEAKGAASSMTPAKTPKAALAAVFATGGEAVLLRVEGRVANSKGDAGGAQAVIRVELAKASPTLIRVMVMNTSAGFTYLDTGYQPESWLCLDANDLLLSGSVRLG